MHACGQDGHLWRAEDLRKRARAQVDADSKHEEAQAGGVHLRREPGKGRRDEPASWRRGQSNPQGAIVAFGHPSMPVLHACWRCTRGNGARTGQGLQQRPQRMAGHCCCETSVPAPRPSWPTARPSWASPAPESRAVIGFRSGGCSLVAFILAAKYAQERCSHLPAPHRRCWSPSGTS